MAIVANELCVIDGESVAAAFVLNEKDVSVVFKNGHVTTMGYASKEQALIALKMITEAMFE